MSRGGGDEKSTEDPDEPIISLKKGPHSEPWHPRTMAPPHVFKVSVIGARKTGKSSLAYRLVSRTFDAQYRPTRVLSQLFWRTFDETAGTDVLVEIEDTPGLEISPGSSATPEQLVNIGLMLKPLMWFEKRRKEKEIKAAVDTSETSALLEDGSPRIAGSAKQNKSGAGGGLGGLKAGGFGGRGGNKKAKKGEDSKPNPIASDRKRMGFVIVADVSSSKSFDTAYSLVDRIFDRLQFDVGDSIICPVSIVIAGNKSDLRSQRQMPEEEALKDQIHAQYSNKSNEPSNNVIYVECSAQTNLGIEEVFKQSLKRIRQLPSRSRIRTARMRVSGFCGRVKRTCFSFCPFMFDVEDSIKKFNRKYIKPCIKRLGLYAIICECAPLMMCWKRIKQAWRTFLTFRWLCSWCPPFMLKLKKEVSADEQDAAVDELERQLEGGGKKDDEEEDD